MRQKILLGGNKVLVVLTLLAYLSAFISPEWVWLAGFFAYLVPLLFLFHFIYLYIWWKRDWKKMLYSFLTLIIGYKFLFSTLAINFDTGGEYDFTLLSYNARVFNVYESDRTGDYEPSKQMIKWLLEDDSDIKCVQEYYHRNQSEIFNTNGKLTNGGKYHSYIAPKIKSRAQEFGLAIFTKFPILKTGRIEFEEESKNDAIFADVLIKKDTVRIINVHLESMHINESKLTETDNWKENAKDLSQRLKKGFVARAQQLDAIEEYVLNCPHRVILSGDLNDPPYSYTYFKLLRMLRSSFEHAGNGFGFSYNGMLFFLRIDNQFYSNGLRPTNYFTLRDVKYSDHFPVKGFYRLEAKQPDGE